MLLPRRTRRKKKTRGVDRKDANERLGGYMHTNVGGDVTHLLAIDVAGSVQHGKYLHGIRHELQGRTKALFDNFDA
jgi:hypothetical protein